MITLHNQLLKIVLLLSLSNHVQAQKIETFIELFNEKKIDEIKKIDGGYISPSLLKHEKSIVRPITKVTEKEAEVIVSEYYKSMLKHAEEKGKEMRENDAREHQRAQTNLTIAWKEVLNISKEADIDVTPYSHELKGSNIKLIIIIFSTEGKVVLVKSLGKIGAKVDHLKEQLEGRDLWIEQLKQMKKSSNKM